MRIELRCINHNPKLLEETNAYSAGQAYQIISAGRSGILFPSIHHPSETNLVISNSNLEAGDRLWGS